MTSKINAEFGKNYERMWPNLRHAIALKRILLVEFDYYIRYTPRSFLLMSLLCIQ